MTAQALALEVVLAMRRIAAKAGKRDSSSLREAGIAAAKADKNSPHARQHFGEASQIHGLLEQFADCIRAKKGFAATLPKVAEDLPKEVLERYEAALSQPLE